MRYTVQRPQIVWVETVVYADTLEEALELGDERIKQGDYLTLDQTIEINFEQYWVGDEDGNQYTDKHHPTPTK